MYRIFIVLFCLCTSSFAVADESLDAPLNARVEEAFRAVRAYNQGQGIVLAAENLRHHVDERAVVYFNDAPKNNRSKVALFSEHPDDIFSVTTVFQRRSPTITKSIRIQEGAGDMAWFRFDLLKGGADQISLQQYVVNDAGRVWQIYESPTDIYFYTQIQDRAGHIEIKEWIYAERPNAKEGSVYRWKLLSEEFNRFVEFKKGPGESVMVQRYPTVGNVAGADHRENKRIIEVVRRALGFRPVKIFGLDSVASMPPVTYLTKENLLKRGVLQIENSQELSVFVSENPYSYPIIIDPAVVITLPTPGVGKVLEGISVGED